MPKLWDLADSSLSSAISRAASKLTRPRASWLHKPLKRVVSKSISIKPTILRALTTHTQLVLFRCPETDCALKFQPERKSTSTSTKLSSPDNQLRSVVG